MNDYYEPRKRLHLRATSEENFDKSYDSSSLASSDREEEEDGDISPLFGSNMGNDTPAQETVRSFVSFAAAAEKNDVHPCSS